jgi:homoserine kinase
VAEAATAFAPGSASNLGPGFDCLGVAFTGKGDHVSARRADAPGVRVAAISDARIPTDPRRNTAALAAAAVLRRVGSSTGLELTIEKGLPLAGGMGGSAASAVAGAVAADAILDARLSVDELLEAALEAEAAVSGRHADNVAPSLVGGAVLIAPLEPPRLTRIAVDPGLCLVLVTPSYGVETARARAILPLAVPRKDAVLQAAHLAGLVLGLERGDHDLIRASLVDRIAEPSRAVLYPGYEEARRAGTEAGALGVVVSGAGPTLVAWVAEAQRPAVAKALVEGYRHIGVEAVAHEARVDPRGARVV